MADFELFQDNHAINATSENAIFTFTFPASEDARQALGVTAVEVLEQRMQTGEPFKLFADPDRLKFYENADLQTGLNVVFEKLPDIGSYAIHLRWETPPDVRESLTIQPSD